jgi:antitoxin HicB
MKYTYTAVFTPTEDGKEFYARVPDVPGCVTTGDDIEDAMEQITDALGGCLVVAEDQGLDIAAPTPQSDIPHGTGDVLSLIRVDTIAYRARTDNRAVRKNVSIPAWMAKLADQRGINCSKLLQDALSQALA